MCACSYKVRNTTSRCIRMRKSVGEEYATSIKIQRALSLLSAPSKWAVTEPASLSGRPVRHCLQIAASVWTVARTGFCSQLFSLPQTNLHPSEPRGKR